MKTDSYKNRLKITGKDEFRNIAIMFLTTLGTSFYLVNSDRYSGSTPVTPETLVLPKLNKIFLKF